MCIDVKYVPKEMVKKVKEVDLLTYFMNYNPSELVKKGKCDNLSKNNVKNVI